MLRWISRAVTVVALCCAIGLQWIILQSIAWTAMIVEQTKCANVRRAISQTFDGSHPCALCHAVSKGKASEQKREFQSTELKIDIAAVTRDTCLHPRDISFEYPSRTFLFSERAHSPPIPPPRDSLG